MLSTEGGMRARRTRSCWPGSTGFGALVITFLLMTFPGPASAQEPNAAPTTGACSPTDRATLTLDEGERSTLTFDRERGRKALFLDFSVTGCSFADNEVGGDLQVQNMTPVDTKDHELSAEFGAGARIKAPDRVAVTFSVDPTSESRPGSFTGGIAVTDPRVNLARVPVTMTLQYDRWGWLALTTFLPAVLIASVTIWYKGRLAGATDTYRRWWTKAGNVFGILVGLVAARAAWGKAYLDDPDFGTDVFGNSPLAWPFISTEWLALATVVVTALIGAATAASVGGDRARGGVDKPGGQGRV